MIKNGKKFDIIFDYSDRSIAGFSGTVDGEKVVCSVVPGDKYTVDEALEILKNEHDFYDPGFYSNMFLSDIKFKPSNIKFSKEEAKFIHENFRIPLLKKSVDSDTFLLCYLEDALMPKNTLSDYRKQVGLVCEEMTYFMQLQKEVLA